MVNNICIMNIYKNWLNSQGLSFHETSFGLLFSYQGGGFIIANNKNDKDYLQLIMPNIYTVDSISKQTALKVANNLNRDIKGLKVIINDDNSVWLTIEQFLDETPEVEDFMDRLLAILLQGRLRFNMLME